MTEVECAIYELCAPRYFSPEVQASILKLQLPVSCCRCQHYRQTDHDPSQKREPVHFKNRPTVVNSTNYVFVDMKSKSKFLHDALFKFIDVRSYGSLWSPGLQMTLGTFCTQKLSYGLPTLLLRAFFQGDLSESLRQ